MNIRYANLLLPVFLVTAACSEIEPKTNGSEDSTAPAQVGADDPNEAAHKALVSAYVDSYNRCDSDSFAEKMHEDIELIAIDNSRLEVTNAGKPSLMSTLSWHENTDCFSKSTLADWSVNGPFVTVKETATWTTKDGSPGKLTALSVYEIDNGKIRRVWYFPDVRDGKVVG